LWSTAVPTGIDGDYSMRRSSRRMTSETCCVNWRAREQRDESANRGGLATYLFAYQ
jgi:hypothetical protein